MKTPIALATPLLAVGLAAGLVALAPVGSTGFVNRNHDEGITTNGEVDLPF